MTFENREDAGRLLGKKIQKQLDGRLRNNQLIVLGLPRGGAVVAREVARVLRAPLDLILVRKLRHPDSPECAIGAVAESDMAIYNETYIKNIDPTWLKLEEESARELIDMRRDLYFEGQTNQPVFVKNRRVVLVDDGIATGMTMRAAIQHVISKGAEEIIVATPVASREALEIIQKTGVSMILLDNPKNFYGSVGMHYKNFEQVSDIEVRRLLLEYSQKS
jgi:predicted phosphoribosyltransferase